MTARSYAIIIDHTKPAQNARLGVQKISNFQERISLIFGALKPDVFERRRHAFLGVTYARRSNKHLLRNFSSPPVTCYNNTIVTLNGQGRKPVIFCFYRVRHMRSARVDSSGRTRRGRPTRRSFGGPRSDRRAVLRSPSFRPATTGERGWMKGGCIM